MKKFFVGVFAVVISLTGAAVAQSTTDFTGTYAMNPKEGKNLGMAAVIKQTVVASQTEDTIVFDITNVFQGKTTTRQITYALSGEPVDNLAAMGDPSKTVSTWTDGKLVTTWTSEGPVAGTQVVRTETRSLSDDGQKMIVETVRDEKPPVIMVYDRTE